MTTVGVKGLSAEIVALKAAYGCPCRTGRGRRWRRQATHRSEASTLDEDEDQSQTNSWSQFSLHIQLHEPVWIAIFL